MIIFNSSKQNGKHQVWFKNDFKMRSEINFS